MPTTEELKSAVQAEIDRRGEALIQVAKTILDHPETGFREQKTSQLVAEQFRDFNVPYEDGIAITGLKGMLDSGTTGPTVGVMGELDSLKVLGHPHALEASDAHAYPEAGPPWQVAKLYAIAQIDDGQWEALRPEFTAAGIDTAFLEQGRHRTRGPGPETATVALDVAPYSESQRRALLAHRTPVPPDNFWVRMPDALRRRAYATAYFRRLYPPAAPGEHEQDLLDGLDLTAGPV